MQSSAIIKLVILTILVSCTLASAWNIMPASAQSPCEWTTVSNGGGNLTPEDAACPLTLAVDMQGNIATVRMTRDGVLCAACVAKDASDKHTLQLDEGTKVSSADNTVPLILRFQETSESPPTPENTVIVGPAYEINAYYSTPPATPAPVTILPSARLILTYEPDELPDNTSEVSIATYDTE